MPVGERGGDLVMEVVARQRGVVDLDVDLHLVLEAVRRRNECTVGDVVVVLVLGRLERLGLDQELPSKPIFLCSTAMWKNRPSWSISRGMSVLSSVS